MTQRALGQMVVGNVLATSAIRYPHAPAFYCASTDRRFSFSEVDARTNRLSQALLSRGLKRGDVLAFLLSNRAEIVEVYFALARTGIVGLPLNYRLTETELIELMYAMRATALVYEKRFGLVAHRLRAALPDVDPIIRIDGDGNAIGDDYEELLAAASPQAPSIEIEETDPFYFNLTSGTTGVPKSYILTHYNNTTLDPLLRTVELTPVDVVMTVFPIYGRVGVAWVIGSAMCGVLNVLADFEPAEVLRLIEAEGVTIVNLVPTMAAMLLSVQAASPRDLSSLRAIVFAGANLPASIREQTMKSLCRDIYEFYGMNEMGPLVISNPEDRRQRPDSVGKPITFSQVRIVDDKGTDLSPNQIGEILGRSPMGAIAYFDNPEKSAETFRSGWVRTGDLGCLDEDGFLFIRGRKKDLIVTGGQNVYPAEVEEIVLRHESVAECAVFGLPDDLWGERVVCVAVPRSAADLTVAGLEAFCRRNLASFKVPKEFVLDSGPLPRTSTNKVQKFLLAARFGRAN
jgi:fatty-acyl-CoA synthase